MILQLLSKQRGVTSFGDSSLFKLILSTRIAPFKRQRIRDFIVRISTDQQVDKFVLLLIS